MDAVHSHRVPLLYMAVHSYSLPVHLPVAWWLQAAGQVTSNQVQGWAGSCALVALIVRLGRKHYLFVARWGAPPVECTSSLVALQQANDTCNWSADSSSGPVVGNLYQSQCWVVSHLPASVCAAVGTAKLCCVTVLLRMEHTGVCGAGAAE
jgi:hypothetical protein